MGRQRKDSNDHDHDHDQDHDPTMVNSSIALLQERFRQLEKVKERREGKELLKLFSSETQRSRGSSSSASMHLPAPDYSSLHPTRHVVALPHNHRPTLQHDSLSLGLNTPSKLLHDHHSTIKTSSNSSLWSEAESTSNFEHSDVDTSLHL